jgi:hypothetical protein
MSQWLRLLAWSSSALMFAYILTYVVLSVNGRYQPLGIHLTYTEYGWAPWGFYDPDHPWPGSRGARRNPGGKTGVWNHMMYVFAPLWIVDIRWIHRTKSM